MEQPPQQPKRIKAFNRTYDLQYWNAKHHTKYSEIELFNKTTNAWESVAEIKIAHHAALADFIVSKIKAHNRSSDQLEEAINALKLCLESDDLSWEAEQESEAVLKKTQKNMGQLK